MVDYAKEPVKGEPAEHTVARQNAIKAAAEKAATARKAALKRNANSNSAQHDATVAAAKKEADQGFSLMASGARSIGLGQQRIAHAMLTLDKEEAFIQRVNFAKWFAHSSEQTKALSTVIRDFLVGDAPDKPPKGEHSVTYANDFAAWRAKNAAVTRSIPFAAALAILLARADKKVPAPTFDDKRGWHVPVLALCTKEQTPRSLSDMAFLDNTSRVVTVERMNAQGAKTEALMSVRCSVEQVVTAVKSRHIKAKAGTADNKGANENNSAADKKNTLGPFSITVLAADPTPLLTAWHEMTRNYRTESLATLDTKVVSTLQRLNIEIGEFLKERARVKAAVNQLPTTEAGRSALVKGEAAKREEAKANG